MEPADVGEGEVISAPPDALAVRRRFGSYLSGEGIEIGPGHVPFPVSASASVRYVDRWSPATNRQLFPELGETQGFPEPHLVANLDEDRLACLLDSSQDFVIASHVLEHLANPLAMLGDIHRVLRPGGLLILLLPDRHKTFDRYRSPTPLAHLIDEHTRDVREVDDDHIVDFLVGTQEPGDAQRSTVEFTTEALDLHRRRSVHAHVWNADEFSAVIAYAENDLGFRWEIVDTMISGSEGTYGDEFGWVLMKKSDGSRRRAGALRILRRRVRRH